MARELELKFKLTSITKWRRILQRHDIVLSERVRQEDIIFLRKGKGYSDLSNGEPALRIRREKKETTSEELIKVAVKKYVNGVKDREEIEFSILKVTPFDSFLAFIDYVPVIEVKKYRSVGCYKGVIITLDKVDKLGLFAEIEIISDDINIEADTQKLYTIAEELGFKLAEAISMPYDEMLYYLNL